MKKVICLSSVDGNEVAHALTLLGYECHECYEGCLLDNFAMSSYKFDTEFFFREKYLNSNSSEYEVTIASGKDARTENDKFYDESIAAEEEVNA